MRAVMLEVPEALLEERRRKGVDVFDEMWDGVLHMVPPPGELHQRISTRLLVVLVELADRRGLIATHETGVFRPGRDDDYRIPDLVVAVEKHRSRRGVEGRAVLVVEVRSPGDETDAKVPFYAEVGVGWLLHVDAESREVELLQRVGEEMVPVAADADGWFNVEPLGLSLRTTAEPQLELRWPGGTSEI